ncbi:4'-phosphopantetheinyl transferase superfamily protein [bacterium SCSIO 12643]|nr:4'-phosphopantetheinyl transferase superfamily protein [bacterium SCSIO 12643]
MKFIKNNILSNGSRLIIVQLDLDIIDHVWDIKLSPEELHKYRTISHDKRKCEFLSIRKVIQTIYNEEEYISYSKNGKPNLAISGHKISISHSDGLLGILIHPGVEVGIDLQVITPKIARIKHKFMSEAELISSKELENQMIVYWCAKEALFKYYSKGNVEFKSNLFIEPFNMDSSGELCGQIHMPDMDTSIPMNYELIGNTMIVYTMEKPTSS